MPATDLPLRVKRALVAIVNGSADVQAVTGRTTRNLVQWGSLAGAPRPVLAYHLVVAPQVGGLGDSRQFDLQLSAFADDTASEAADSIADRLLGVVEAILTPTAFAACTPPLEAVVIDLTRRDGSGAEADSVSDAGTLTTPPGAGARADLDVSLDVTA
jgi:hypothetical protein